MKTNFMKKAMMLTTIMLTIVLSTAFDTKESKLKSVDGDEYIFLTAYAGNQNNSKNTYISDIIHYQGYDACFKEGYNTSHDFFAAAGRKFMKDIEKYNNIDISQWKIQYNGKNDNVSFPSGYFRGYDSKSEAQKSKNIAIENQRGGEVFKTYFTYSCE